MRIEPISPLHPSAGAAIGPSTTFRDPGRAPIGVRVSELSMTSALLETEDILPPGTLINIGIAGAGMQRARVTGVASGGMTVDFIVPLDARAVAVAGQLQAPMSVAIPQIAIERPAADGSVVAASAAIDRSSAASSLSGTKPGGGVFSISFSALLAPALIYCVLR